jgi:hypothetical protein
LGAGQDKIENKTSDTSAGQNKMKYDIQEQIKNDINGTRADISAISSGQAEFKKITDKLDKQMKNVPKMIEQQTQNTMRSSTAS